MSDIGTLVKLTDASFYAAREMQRMFEEGKYGLDYRTVPSQGFLFNLTINGYTKLYHTPCLTFQSEHPCRTT